MKVVAPAVIGKHRKAQGPRFPPARYNFYHGFPGTLNLEAQGTFMHTVPGIGFHQIGQNQDSWYEF